MNDLMNAVGFIGCWLMWIIGSITACFTFLNGITVGPIEAIWWSIPILGIAQFYGYRGFKLLKGD